MLNTPRPETTVKFTTAASVCLKNNLRRCGCSKNAAMNQVCLWNCWNVGRPANSGFHFFSGCLINGNGYFHVTHTLNLHPLLVHTLHLCACTHSPRIHHSPFDPCTVTHLMHINGHARSQLSLRSPKESWGSQSWNVDGADVHSILLQLLGLNFLLFFTLKTMQHRHGS